MTKRKVKLTDVELSKVLSRAAVGGLDHMNFGNDECGCVAGTIFGVGAYNFGEFSYEERCKMGEISDAVAPPIESRDYGGDPDSVLRYLEKRGVA